MKKIIREGADVLVVLLHGLGSNAAEFFYVAQVLASKLPFANFYVPDAFEPFYMEGGFQWFDIGDRNESFLSTQICKAHKKLDAELSEKLAEFGMNDSQLVLGGFSQGAMMSLHTSLRRKNPCLAVCAFSGRLISPEQLPEEIQSRPDVCVIHGTSDDVVPFFNYDIICNALSRNNVPFTGYKINGLGHYITDNEIDLAARFIGQKYEKSKQKK